MKMQTKRLLTPIILAFMMITVTLSSAYADPFLLAGNVVVGNLYSISTTTGRARAWINGAWATGPADLQLQVQITFVGPYNIIFRIVSGTFQIRYKQYAIDSGRWRGDYNLITHSSEYRGPATAPDGGQAYFVLSAQDTIETGQVAYMNIQSNFRGEYGALWQVTILAYRIII